MKTKIYLFFLLFSLITKVSFAQCPNTYGPNLVVNGDFSGGPSGFSTDYGTSLQGCVLNAPKTFLVTSTPCNFEITGDHTTAAGAALYVNGDANDADAVGAGQADAAFATQRVWYQTVSVTPLTTYTLAAWMANATDQAHCSCGGPVMTGRFSQLNFYVNGTQVGSTFTLSGFGTWMQFSGTWNSGSATSAEISIVDVNDAYWWNDFGIDDISFKVTTPTTLTVTPTVTAAHCNGAHDGSIHLSVHSSAPGTTSVLGYTYSWTPSGSGNPATGLGAGTYSVTVTDIHGCTGTASAVVGQPDPISVSIKIGREVSCHGGRNGMLLAEASGGTGTLHYSWSPSGGSDAMATELGAGTYTVTVTDANGCTGTATVTLNDPTAITLVPHVFDPLCHGGVGFMDVDAYGGSPFYSYNWTTGGTAIAFYDVLFGYAGTYGVTVTDMRGCQATGSYTIADPAAINIAGTTANVRCHGGNNGVINTTVTGGTAPYHYSWSNGAHSGDLAGLSAGTYNVVVADAHGCSSNATFTITEPSAITLSAHVSNVRCHGDFGGYINVEAAGGSPYYTYNWYGAPAFEWYNNLWGFAGTYSVLVRDTHGCSAIGHYTITEPAAIHIVAVTGNVSCNGGDNGSINTTVTGGTAPYHYHWSNGSHEADLSHLSAGTYHVAVTDSHGCSSEASYTITEPSAIHIIATTSDVSCYHGNNGHINTTVSGGTPGYTYTWSNGSHSADPSGLSAGAYHVIVRDAHGCSASANYTVNEPSAIRIAAETENASCFGSHTGHIGIVASGGTPGYHYAWSNGSHDADQYHLSAGIYHVTVFDEHGCNASAAYTITEPNYINISASVTEVGCHNGDNGRINTHVTGGTPGYHYSWSNGSHEADPSHLSAGTYHLTVTDDHGCTATASYAVTEPARIDIFATTADVSCHGGHNGAINAHVTGGTAPYYFHWSNGSHDAGISHLSAGIYHLEVTDAHGCHESATYSVHEPSILNVSATSTNVSCYGGNNGSINTTVTGGTPGYNYLWSNGSHAADPSGLSAGTYHVLVSDGHSCLSGGAYTITQPSEIRVIASVENVHGCHGEHNGHIDVHVSGGTHGYSYSWSNGSHEAEQWHLGAGVYHVEVTDANGCHAGATYTVTEPAAIIITASVSNVNCHGEHNGHINSHVSGSVAPYHYSWSNGSHEADPSHLAAGTYDVEVVDAHGCHAHAAYTVTEPAPLEISGVAANISCHGEHNGSINTTVTGGTAPYHYHWSNGAHDGDLSHLAPGIYHVWVTDAHGCATAATYTITEPSLLAVSGNANHIICHGEHNGHINITVTGGTPGYSYLWSNGSHEADQFHLGAGTYHVEITDAHGCHTGGTYIITEPAAIDITASVANASCHGEHNGGINSHVSGGVAPYHYSWSNGSHEADLHHLEAGVYHLEVTDNRGCHAFATYTVTEPTHLEVSASSANVSCNGAHNGTINTTVTGGTAPYHYHWSNGSHDADLSHLAPGSYNLLVTDAHGCAAVAHYTITQPSAITIAATTTNVSCHGGNNGTIHAVVTGGTPGYTYSWHHGCATADPSDLAAGTYVLTVTDAHGCTASATYTITEPSAITIAAHAENVHGCHGEQNGHINTTVSGGTAGYHYSWSNGSHEADLHHVAAGTYDVTVTDAHGCTSSASYTVTEPAAISITASTAGVSCHGGHNGAINTHVAGGMWPYHYIWSNGAHAADLSHLAAGTYHLVVVDAHGCHATASYTVTEPAILSVSAATANVSCHGGDNGHINTTVTGGTPGYNYLWSNGCHTADPSGLSAGIYHVVVADAHGCITGGAYTITQPSAITVTASVENVHGCHGEHNGHINTHVTGGAPGYSYSWSNGSHEADPSHLGAGVYHVEIADANGCHTGATYTVTEPAAIIVSASVNNASCFGEHNGSIHAHVSGGVAPYHYSWSTGSHDDDLHHLAAGTYHLEVTDAHGCHAFATYIVAEPSHIEISANSANVSCHGAHNGTINTTVTGGTAPYHYHWSNGSHDADLSHLAPGSYNLLVTDAHGCATAAHYTLTEPSAIAIAATTTNVSCHGGNNGIIHAVVTGGTPGYTYLWHHGCATADPSDLAAGTYVLTVTDAHGCTASATYTITEPVAITITAHVENVRGCHGEHNGHINTTVSGGTAGYHYSWSNGSHEADLHHVAAGTYDVTVTDTHGCTASASYTVTEPAAISITASTSDVSCHGGHNGAINTHVTGGIRPYHYIWSNGAHAADLSHLAAGTYHLVVVDAHGCHATASYTVTEPAVLSVSATTANVSCHGGDNGHINTTVTGGTPGYNYLWSNGCHTADPSGLSAGIYHVVVADAHGCITGGAYSVTEPAAITIAGNVHNVTGCHGDHTGSVNTTVSGGTAPYSYSWSNGCHTADPSHLDAGCYHLTVTDAHGCTASASYTITEPAAISITAHVHDVEGCHGEHNGHINTHVIGGTAPYHYNWSNGSHEADPHHLAAGTYNVEVTDAHGCHATASYIVTEPAAIAITADATNVSCHGEHNGRIITTVTGGAAPYHYNWSNGSHEADLSHLCVGVYHLEVTDAHGCHSFAYYTITEPAALAIIATTTNVSCHGGNNGTIHAVVTGGTPGYTYSWHHGCATADPSDLAAGTYVLTVTDAHGCTASATYTITEPAAITLAAHVENVRGCHGEHNGHINTTVTGGVAPYHYSWSNGSHEADLHHVGAGSCEVTVTDANGCHATASYTIDEPSEISITAHVHNVEGCHGEHNGHINTTVTGGMPGYHYSWSNGSHEADQWHLAAGVYHLEVVDEHGCHAHATYTVSEDASMTITGTSTDVTCNGDHNGHINTSVSGGTPGYNYVWSSGCHEADPSGLSAGTYHVIVSDSRGCHADATYTVGEPAAINISGAVTGVSCNGAQDGSINLTVTGGACHYSYCWSNGSHSADQSDLAPGCYHVTVTDGHGCTATATYIITEPSPLSVTGTTTAVTCLGCSDGHINTTVTGGTPGYTYTWSNGATTADLCGLAAGCYGVIVYDAHGCAADAKFTVTEPVRCLSRTTANGGDANGGATTGVNTEDGTAADVIKVYPNPTNGVFNVVIPIIHTDAQIFVSDATGKTLDTKTVSGNTGAPYQFSLDLATGIYFVKVFAGETTYVEKIIVR